MKKAIVLALALGALGACDKFGSVGAANGAATSSGNSAGSGAAIMNGSGGSQTSQQTAGSNDKPGEGGAVLSAPNMSAPNMRAGFRESAVQSCVAASHPNAPANFDWQRQCSCAIDRYMANKSDEDLRNTNAQDPALQAAGRQCAIEQVNAASGAPGQTSAPAGDEGKPD